MYTGKTLFAQIMDFLPWNTFHRKAKGSKGKGVSPGHGTLKFICLLICPMSGADPNHTITHIMKLVNSIFIKRPAKTVWAFLENPANMLLWNPKVKRVSPSSFSSPQQGYRYAITYQMHKRARASEFMAEFVHFEPFSKLVIRLTEGPSPRDRVIKEIYELSEREAGTFLTQTIHIENSGINIFFRFLIRIIQRWGKPTGKPYLATFRDIIERDNSQ